MAHAAAKPQLAAGELQRVTGDAEIMETLKDVRSAKKVRRKD